MEEDLQSALDPERLNENKFAIPEDDEATKAIPVITADRPFRNLDETVVHGEEPDHKPNKKKQPDKNKSQKKKRKWPIILTSIFAFLVLGITLLVLMGPDLFGPKEKPVPEVAGLDLEEAVSDLVAAGFIIGDKKELSDDNIEEGHIIRTNPRPGKVVKEGTLIDLYISTGKERFELSDYRGRMYEDVASLLEDLNFRDIKTTQQHDDSEPGTILDQNPDEGEEVIPSETVLEFTISMGPELVRLIDLTGHTAKSVSDYADTTGLSIDITEEYNEDVEKGLVVSQNPQSGTELKKGSKVSVVISKGVEEIPPKEVTEEIAIVYDESLEGEEMEIQIYIQDMNRSMTTPVETFTITETITKKLEFTIAHDTPAGYRVFGNNMVINQGIVEYPED
jgi:serine/threonine-protein kinase